MVRGGVVLISLYDFDSLGIRSLHAALQHAGYSPVSIFFKDMVLNEMRPPSSGEMDQLIALVTGLRPQIVGISVRSTFFKFAGEITARLKKQGIFVLWGGIHPTTMPEQSVQHCDAICIGAGEEPLIELIRRREIGQPIRDILNLWVRDNGEVVRNPVRPLASDLEQRPLPYWGEEDCYFLEGGRVFDHWPWGQRKRYPIMTSLGCPFACTYCCNSAIHRLYRGKGKYVRRRSVSSVIQELVLARDRFPYLELIDFYDDVFTFDRRWLEEFCGRYEQAVALPFFCYTHPNVVDEGVFRRLKKAGLRSVAMGIQSGAPHIRKDYLKRSGHTNEDIVRAARLFHELRLQTAFDVLLDNPFEGQSEKRQTLELLLQLPPPFELHQHSLTFFPNTEITVMALARDYVSEEDIEGERQKTLQHWTRALDSARSREDAFWDVLYFMTRFELIPRGVIRRVSRSDFWQRNPHLMRRVLSLLSPLLRLGSALHQYGWWGTWRKMRGLVGERVWRFRAKTLNSSNLS